jgi:galactose mutarotase-like enzyme
MVVLENDEIQVTLSLRGAELISLIEKKDQTEYIWQADSAIWPFNAPNLFPIVGALNDNNLSVNGKSYELNRHGFARTSIFRRLESAPQQAVFELRYNEDTLKIYPFKFEFQVIYHLIGRKLNILYKVINMDDKTIFFSIGAHPGFNVPLNSQGDFEDYYIEFEHQEDLITHQLTENGVFNNQTQSIPTEGEKLPLKMSLFEKDALVFKKLNSNFVTLKSTKTNKQVKVDFPHFNYLGLWSKKDAPFVCIEPWLGCADTDGERKDIAQKEAIQKIEHGHVFEVDFSISI